MTKHESLETVREKERKLYFRKEKCRFVQQPDAHTLCLIETIEREVYSNKIGFICVKKIEKEIGEA